MQSQPLAQLPTGRVDQQVITVIDSLLRERAWHSMTAAFAYVTAGGLLALLKAVEGTGLVLSHKWLFGLDDCLTQPTALEIARKLPRSELRVCSLLRSHGCRFHAKVLHLAAKDSSDAMLIGSANLTVSALDANAEAITVLRSECPGEAKLMKELAVALLALGKDPTQDEIDQYEEAYKAARQHHKAIATLSRRLPQTSFPRTRRGTEKREGTPLDPGLASVCWIDVGKNTAQGRELELKAEQALFFNLHHAGGDRQARRFRVSDGSFADLNFKYQGNAMWRLQMSNVVPEVRMGLRPIVNGRLQRSPFAAVFERGIGNTYVLRFVRDGSPEYRRLVREAQDEASYGETQTRAYGWS